MKTRRWIAAAIAEASKDVPALPFQRGSQAPALAKTA